MNKKSERAAEDGDIRSEQMWRKTRSDKTNQIWKRRTGLKLTWQREKDGADGRERQRMLCSSSPRCQLLQRLGGKQHGDAASEVQYVSSKLLFCLVLALRRYFIFSLCARLFGN